MKSLLTLSAWIVVLALVTGCQTAVDNNEQSEADNTEQEATGSDSAAATPEGSDAPAPEAPAPEEPTSEEPTSEEPAPEEPAPEEPDPTDAVKPETPKPETPKPDTPKPDTPKPDTATAPPAKANGDYTQWGYSSHRNNVLDVTNVPTDWDIGEFDRKTGEWQSEKSKNIKWVARLGSQTYGNTIVAGGRIFMGTNNGAGYLKRYPDSVDLGCMLCFNETDGKFLWQYSGEKLSTGRVNDWEHQGVCSTSIVEENRLWFISNRGHVVCLDTEGYYDGEDDGPMTAGWARQFKIGAPRRQDLEEAQAAAAAKAWLAAEKAAINDGKLSEAARAAFEKSGITLPTEITINQVEKNGKKSGAFTAEVEGKKRDFTIRFEGPKLTAFMQTTVDDTRECDTVWVLDMMKELGVQQHNMAACSATIMGDLLFVCTSNGVAFQHNVCPAPDAPSFLAIDKNTGKVLWSDNSPGENIVHGQWSSPAAGVLGGVPQVIFAGGDGYLYSFLAEKTEDGKAKLLWKFDCNPKESLWKLSGLGTRNNIICTPLIYDGKVYVAVGQDPEHGDGEGHMWCIDPTKRGDVSPDLAFSLTELSKPAAERTPLPHRRLQAVDVKQGEKSVPNPNSAVLWHYAAQDADGDGEIDEYLETMHRTVSSSAIKDGLLYTADFSGIFHCVDAKTGKLLWTHDMLSAAWGSPLIADGKVYIGDEDGDVTIFKLSREKEIVAEIFMGSSVYSTPIVANGVLYIPNKSYLFAIVVQKEL